MANAWEKFWSFNWLPHPGYDSTADAAKAFFMPSAYSSEKNAEMQRETNLANRQLVELQNQQNIEQWNRENAFNDPSNAMQRLRGAGLNPALMYGNGVGQLSSAPSPTMQASRDEAATWQQDDMLSKMMMMSQISNIDAQTEKTKEETKEKEISNEVGGMNAQAFKSAYEEGLVHSATKAGFGKLIDDYRGNRYTLFESAWNFAILTGCSLSDSLKSSDEFQTGTYDGDGHYIPDFNSTDAAYKRAQSLYIGGTEAQISANEAAKMVAELQKKQKQKDVDIWKWLNDKAKSDKWFESVPATIGLIGLWLAEQRFSLPSFQLSISRGKTGVKSGFKVGN